MTFGRLRDSSWFVAGSALLSVVGSLFAFQSAHSARQSAAEAMEQNRIARLALAETRAQTATMLDQKALQGQANRIEQDQTDIGHADLKFRAEEAQRTVEPNLLFDVENGRVVVKNSGQGLARQAWTVPVKRGNATISFNHVGSLSEGQKEPMDFVVSIEGEPSSTKPLTQEEIRDKLTTVARVTQESPLATCTMFQDNEKRWYERRQWIDFSPDASLAGLAGIRIRSEGHPRMIKDNTRACLPPK